MRRIALSCILFWMSLGYGFSQTPVLHILETGKATNLRGFSSQDGKSIWVSGSSGQTGLSKDSGKTWAWHIPKGYENRDFRDIAALGEDAAVTIAVDTPAVILKTTDGGLHWRQVYKNNRPGMFLDAMDFADHYNGVVVGDPVDGQVFLAKTTNAGDSWQTFTPDLKDSIARGEAFFAASGSNIHLQNDGAILLSSGGARSRLWKSHQRATLLPFQQGNLTAGPNGMDVKGNIIAIAGGNYTQPDSGDSSYAISYDGGQHWQPYNKLPGYGSAVAIISDSVLVACGLKGVWLTKNGGKDWATIDARPFNALLYIPRSKKLFLAGPNGTIALLEGL